MSEERTPRQRPDFDWALWVKWILATTLGWAVGLALGESGQVAVGIPIGLAQWFVLRKRVERSELWVLASGVGWAAGYGLLVAFSPPQATVLAGGAIGATLGVAQWLVLRLHLVQSWWWIVVSALSWGVGLTGFLGAPLVGSIAGAVTGLALEPLLRYSSSRNDEAA